MARTLRFMTIAVAGIALVVGSAIPSAPIASAQEAKKGPAPNNPVGADSNWNANVAPGGSGTITLDARQTEIVKRVSGYFNDLTTLRGSFLQTTADNKRMRGKFFVKKPGRFRFDYALPSKQVILSDGNLLAIQDHDLGNEDVVELDNTPFRILLRKDVDILRDARIGEVQEADDVIVVSLQDKNPDSPGRFTAQRNLSLSTGHCAKVFRFCCGRRGWCKRRRFWRRRRRRAILTGRWLTI